MRAIITINTDACKGCELCVSVCPKKAIEMAREKLNARGVFPVKVKDADLCIACASCAIMCPDVAITVER